MARPSLCVCTKGKHRVEIDHDRSLLVRLERRLIKGSLRSANASDRKYLAKEVHKERIARKLPRLADDGLQSDSSAEEDVEEASAAPEPDAEITYSYDAAHGPGQGSQILSVAVAQAVERFENHATDKLVKEEYEVLDNEGEAVAINMARKGRHGVAEEDEYEFV